MYPSIHPFIHPSIALSLYLSIDLSIYPSIHPYIHPSIDLSIGGWGGESNREIDFGFVFRVRDRVVRCEAVRDDIWYARGSETFFSSSCDYSWWPAEVVRRSGWFVRELAAEKQGETHGCLTFSRTTLRTYQYNQWNSINVFGCVRVCSCAFRFVRLSVTLVAVVVVPFICPSPSLLLMFFCSSVCDHRYYCCCYSVRLSVTIVVVDVVPFVYL